MRTVVHVSPHPDDESIGAPCTLLALRDAGWRVVNFSVGFGRPDVHQRRRRELAAALQIAGFEHRESAAAPGISRGDNLQAAYRVLTRELRSVVADTGAELVVGPHPRDGHHGHTTVARAIRQVVWTAKAPLTWWMWSIWADLPRPTLVVDCTDKHLQVSREMLEQYGGENERVDYRYMHEPIRTVNAVRGVEKALGFGETPMDAFRDITRAELLTEVTVRGWSWMVGATRVLDPDDISTAWTNLDDMSILGTTRLRPLYHPLILAHLADRRIPRLRVSVEGPLDREAGGTHGRR